MHQEDYRFTDEPVFRSSEGEDVEKSSTSKENAGTEQAVNNKSIERDPQAIWQKIESDPILKSILSAMVLENFQFQDSTTIDQMAIHASQEDVAVFLQKFPTEKFFEQSQSLHELLNGLKNENPADSTIHNLYEKKVLEFEELLFPE